MVTSASFLDAWLSGVVHPTFPFIAGREYLGVKDLSQDFQTFDDAGPWAVEVLGWGQIPTVALNFLIIAGVLFLVIKGINKLKKDVPATPAEPTPEVKLLTNITI